MEERSALDAWVPRLCQVCRKPFLGRVDKIAQGYSRFCTRSCSNRARIYPPLIHRFSSRVHQCVHGHSCQTCCWEWQGNRNKRGYGQFHKGHGQTKLAHVLAWEFFHDRDFPVGQFCCHHCNNPSCVNPHHLYAGTPAMNSADAKRAHRYWTGPRPNTQHRKGSTSPMSKLTEAQVLEIRNSATHTRGEGSTTLARQYGVSKRTIQLILRGKTWRHILEGDRTDRH